MRLLSRLPLTADREGDDPPSDDVLASKPKCFVCSRCAAEWTASAEVGGSSVGVCPSCGAHARLGARDRLTSLIDPGSFREIGTDLRPGDPLGFHDPLPYPERIAEHQARTGLTEALLAGSATIAGRPVVVAILDFGFMGGTMGAVVGERFVRATEIAIKERRPLVTIVGSGGARMQEGIISLLQMAKTAAAVNRLRAEGILYLSILTDPTTGGVFASFASLGDVVVAEPGALIGFAGPRVVEQTIGKPVPPGSHTAEFLRDHGIIDAVVPRADVRGYVATTLAILAPATPTPKLDRPISALPPQESPSAWSEVASARADGRPTTTFYLDRLVSPFLELHGDRAGFDDPAVIAGLGRLGGQPIAIVGFERGTPDDRLHRRDGRPYAEGFRKAQRVMRLAARLRIPLVTLIDTPGPFPGIESEERGLAGQIASTLAMISELPVPTVAAIIGEGGSGAAVALAAADRVLIQEHAIYSVIGPEGAAAILYRDADRASSVAGRLKLTAHDLHALGAVDAVVPEPAPGAAADPAVAAELLGHHLRFALQELQGRSRERLLRARRQRYRKIGLAHLQAERRGNRAERVVELVRRVSPWKSDIAGPASAPPTASESSRADVAG